MRGDALLLDWFSTFLCSANVLGNCYLRHCFARVVSVLLITCDAFVVFSSTFPGLMMQLQVIWILIIKPTERAYK